MAETPMSTASTFSAPQRFIRVYEQPENPFASKVSNQIIAIIPSFTLESGVTLYSVPLAYKTWGKLSSDGDNVIVVCHALTGSADIRDWWGPLIGGPGRIFDLTKFFVICMNSLGSPYGSASPVTYKDGDSKKGIYGPEFPLTTIRDDVNFHKLLLDELGVKRVAAVIGGSMGGMLVLEWAYFGKDYIRCIAPIATSGRHSAWGISWGEAQRQCIYADPKYNDGYYSFEEPPSSGLGAARMSALLTYRSWDSFEARFSRKPSDVSKMTPALDFDSSSPGDIHLAIHNDGHISKQSLNNSTPSKTKTNKGERPVSCPLESKDQNANDSVPKLSPKIEHVKSPALTHFSAQSYLRYKGTQFAKRFDANCYISISRKLDTHDLSRSRSSSITEALAMIEQPALVLGIESDGLFNFSQQEELASAIPNSRLDKIDSIEGHDAFLLQCEQVNTLVLRFLHEVIPDKMQSKCDAQIGQISLETVVGEGLSLVEEMDNITT
ncbi:putative homoserine o-acetyltransferase [Erysiphe necator]|uniref:Putative homoserine o-acetyltransferase n=1 Tax=Uncinula necator TaxID=52586 RepID=A0A0B1P8G8_UNCNE|nr:putative homoserine o-acetyltransferase [Erysiphe necator]